MRCCWEHSRQSEHIMPSRTLWFSLQLIGVWSMPSWNWNLMHGSIIEENKADIHGWYTVQGRISHTYLHRVFLLNMINNGLQPHTRSTMLPDSTLPHRCRSYFFLHLLGHNCWKFSYLFIDRWLIPRCIHQPIRSSIRWKISSFRQLLIPCALPTITP